MALVKLRRHHALVVQLHLLPQLEVLGPAVLLDLQYLVVDTLLADLHLG